jgi:hypothetical protein
VNTPNLTPGRSLVRFSETAVSWWQKRKKKEPKRRNTKACQTSFASLTNQLTAPALNLALSLVCLQNIEMSSGDNKLRDFKDLKLIGKGSFGRVYRAVRCSDGQE